MGSFDVYCSLCGVTLNSIYSDIINKKNMRLFKWLNDVTILIKDKNEVLHGFKEYFGSSAEFIKNKQKYMIHNYIGEYGTKGLVVHTDCWKLVKKFTNKELTYQDLSKFKETQVSMYTLTGLNYKPVNKYWNQFFKFDKLYNNKKDRYVLYSPVKFSDESKKNSLRIQKNIHKIMKINNRKSPTESATIFKIGTKKKGNNGNIYIVKQTKNNVKRWFKI